MTALLLSEKENFKFSEASEAATQFSKIFYERYDGRRQDLEKLYMLDATLIWNGNSVSGAANICKYLAELPPSGNTKVECIDCQPLPDDLTEGRTSMVVNVMGVIRYATRKPQSVPFTETFIMTTQSSNAGSIVWKIAKDCFRLIE
ncbi:NXT2 [Bugula neritina]|uniref:NTF2-related export protein n=1 Tax=Bugula neritina TaxID=10212 RepID=A0A7J7KR67_BUGNE|nr:NXT2 [Bugula neritina]